MELKWKQCTQEHSKYANLRQRQNLNQKCSGIRILIFGCAISPLLLIKSKGDMATNMVKKQKNTVNQLQLKSDQNLHQTISS